MENQRDFKGIWLPKEVYLCSELTWTEKILFCEIDSLDKDDGCFATNAYFAKFLRVNESVISAGISKLKKLGFIEQVAFDGRTRTLKSAFRNSRRQSSENPEGSVLEIQNHNNIDYNNSLDIKDKKIKNYFFIEKSKADKRDVSGYGEFKNVMLTKEEVKKLMNKYQFYFLDAIELLSGYIASGGGKKYKNHYAVLKEYGWVWNEVHKNPDCGIRHGCHHIEDPTQPGGLREETIEEYYKRVAGIEV